MTRYLEDYPVGSNVEVGTFIVTAEEIVEFAQRYDPQPFHLDPEAAARSMFGGLVASGWQTTALMMRVVVDNYLDADSSLGSPGVDELRWLAPLRPDELMTVHCEVLEARASQSKPDRGIMRSKMTVTGGDGAPMLTVIATNLVLRRP